MLRSIPLAAALVLVAVVACTNAGENQTLPQLTRGVVGVDVYLDRNADHVLDAGDTVFAGARIALLYPGGHDTIRTAATDSTGVAVFDSLPIGTYRVAVVNPGDSIGVISGDTGTVRITAQADSSGAIRVIRLGYQEVTIAELRAMARGRRVVVHAHVVSPLQAFRDTSAFISDSSGNLRILDAVAQRGTAGNVIGDSVIVLGTTDSAQGEAILRGGGFTRIAAGLAPAPAVVSVADARTAQGGTLDAALIQLSNVVIVDTAAVDVDFHVTVADPADTTSQIVVVLDQLLNAPHTVFPPGRTATFRGVLIPVGDGTWLLKPRSSADVVLN